VLAGRVRDSAVHVVRPHGLTLEEVGYPPDGELAARNAAARNRRSLPAGGAAAAGCC
jgi:tRNA pseudouridine38-40 synthase